jgi:hypothetical protein
MISIALRNALARSIIVQFVIGWRADYANGKADHACTEKRSQIIALFSYIREEMEFLSLSRTQEFDPAIVEAA